MLQTRSAESLLDAMFLSLAPRRASAICLKQTDLRLSRLLWTSNKISLTPRCKSFDKKLVFERVQRRNYSDFRERNAVGVFTPKSAALFIAAGIGLFFYFRYEKERMLEEREKERSGRQYGRPNVGGPFSLTTHDGKPFTEKDLQGKWSLVYFGFANCPDICPAELDKMSSVLDVLQKDHGDIFLPVFITVDPSRDLPHRIARYLEDFHPSFVGLYGDYDATKAVCKKYRVYFSTPPNADPNGDYLVDHSIFVYLMDPNGQFVEAFGQATTLEDVVTKTNETIKEWEKDTGRKV